MPSGKNCRFLQATCPAWFRFLLGVSLGVGCVSSQTPDQKPDALVGMWQEVSTYLTKEAWLELKNLPPPEDTAAQRAQDFCAAVVQLDRQPLREARLGGVDRRLNALLAANPNDAIDGASCDFQTPNPIRALFPFPIKIMNVAIIGCGSYGAQHAQFLASCAGVHLRAVADIAGERAEAFAQSYGADYATADVDRIWSDPMIEAVWISTQHHTHAPLAEAAAHAGKHFFLEKPLALTLADCNRIVDAVERSGVIAAAGFKLRFFPAVAAAKEFLHRPTLTTAHVIDDHWPSEYWANDPIQGGGNVLSQGCHIMDTVLHLHPSPPVRIYAAGGNRHHPTHDIVDTAAISLTFADGAVASIAVGDAGVPPQTSKFALEQNDGSRSLSLYNRFNSIMTRADHTVTEHPSWPEEGAAVIDRPFIVAISTGGPSPVSVQSARRTTAVMLAAIESIKTGCAINLQAAPYAAALAA